MAKPEDARYLVRVPVDTIAFDEDNSRGQIRPISGPYVTSLVSGMMLHPPVALLSVTLWEDPSMVTTTSSCSQTGNCGA